MFAKRMLVHVAYAKKMGQKIPMRFLLTLRGQKERFLLYDS